MAESTLMGLNGEPNIYECSYVQSDVSEVLNVQEISFALLLFCLTAISR